MKEKTAPKYLKEFPAWLKYAEDHWTDLNDGTAYWGCDSGAGLAHSASVGYLAACAIMGISSPDELRKECHISREDMIERALKIYRRVTSLHASRNASNEQWGRNWGSPILIERMACFIDLLKPHMRGEELQIWKDILLDEANFHLKTDIKTNRFSAEGETHGERNYWRGTILFRAAMELSENEDAGKWLEKSAEFCINSISLPSDEECEIIVDGKVVKERFLGANAHPGAVFEHHGNISSDYSVIPLSFFVMAMTSSIKNEWKPTECMSHHIGDLWGFVKYLLTADARIICFGKQRPRYTIMYNYLLPVLVFWDKFVNDDEAGILIDPLLELGEKDRAESGDGSFCSARASSLKDLSADGRPYYYFRLESDAIISRGLAYLISELPAKGIDFAGSFKTEENSFEKKKLVVEDAAFVSQRTDSGFFGVYWNRSHCAEADPALAMCIPQKNGHRFDCLSNMATIFKPFRPERHLDAWGHVEFDGGFATAANYYEGRYLLSDDEAGYAFYQNMAFILMPDGKSFLRIENTKALKKSTISEMASLNLNLANDIFTGKRFELAFGGGKMKIDSDDKERGIKSIHSNWVNISDELGVVGVYGADKFDLEIFPERNRAYKTLLVERLYYPLKRERISFDTGDIVLNTAVLLLADTSKEETENTAAGLNAQRHYIDIPDVEALSLTLGNGSRVSVFINFSTEEKQLDFNNRMRLEPLKPVVLIN